MRPKVIVLHDDDDEPHDFSPSQSPIAQDARRDPSRGVRQLPLQVPRGAGSPRANGEVPFVPSPSTTFAGNEEHALVKAVTRGGLLLVKHGDLRSTRILNSNGS